VATGLGGRGEGQMSSLTIGGTYVVIGENHGQQVFRRSAPQKDLQDVLLYYWDGHDGEESGWWIGPELGGDVVWAKNMAEEDGVPLYGWEMLPRGDEDDDEEFATSSFVVIDCSATGRSRCEQQPVDMADCAEEPVDNMASRSPSPSRACSHAYIDDDFHSTVASVATPQVATSQGDRCYSQVNDDQHHERISPSRSHPSTRESLESAADFRRNHEDIVSERHDELREWLLGLDEGTGVMMQYFDVLVTEFEDMTQIAAVKNPSDGDEAPRSLIDLVDPSFWDAVQVRKMGHRMLFARGIAKL